MRGSGFNSGRARRVVAAFAGVAACAVSMAAVPAAWAQSGGLKPGEYACFGSGGRILIGLGFKALPGGRYTDLDGKSPGTLAVSGDAVVFKGGHLDGQTGRGLRDNRFNIGSASCEPG